MATIYDVAKAAGVSPKTVSRVLNGDAPVNPATRKSVEDAMVSLGYVPSSAARTMRSNRSGLVGLITGAISQSPEQPDRAGLPDLLIVQSIQRVIQASGKTLLISDTGGEAGRTADLVRTFLQYQVEGLIYVADSHKQVTLPEIAGKVVLANCYDAKGTPSVLPDDERGQYLLVERLIAAGHRRIAYLTLGPGVEATRLRTKGYERALEDAGLPLDPALVMSADLGTTEGERQSLWDSVDRLLRLEDKPTVICCGNDRMAMKLYGILRTRGIDVPGEMSVAGYDNHTMISETLVPPLTTVELPYVTIGARSAELLLSLISEDQDIDPGPHRVSGPVHWRDSVRRRSPNVTAISSKGRI